MELRRINLFDTNSAMVAWLLEHGEPQLSNWLAPLDDRALSELRAVLNEYGELRAKADIGEAATLLGRAIARYMHVAKDADHMPTGAEKKAFVTELAVVQFRLMDGGLDGKGEHFMPEHRAHLGQAFPNGPERDFVRPMADQGVEAGYQVMQRMKNPERH